VACDITVSRWFSKRIDDNTSSTVNHPTGTDSAVVDTEQSDGDVTVREIDLDAMSVNE